MELEERYGTLRPSTLHAQSLGVKSFAGNCDFSARHLRIKNELENYIEDKKICFQGAIRLPEDQTKSKVLIHVQTIYVRRIKSNVENIQQIIALRE